MPMGYTHELKLSGPVTIEELEEFCNQARIIGVPPTKVLNQKITNSYSDPREGSPGNFTLIASP